MMEESKEEFFDNRLLDLSMEKISELMIDDEDDGNIDLDNFESLAVDKKPQIYQNNNPYTFQKITERADVYIKNYLMKFNMHKSLKILEQEFFELLSKGEIEIDSIPNVPEVYIKSETLQEQIGSIQKELDDAKIYAEKAKSLYQKLFQAKENEKIKHRRVQQEKQKLIKDIDKMKKIYEDDNKTYKELKRKYWDVTNKSLIIEQQIKGFKSSIETLDEQIDKIKKSIEESKKLRDSKIILNIFCS
jgi:hypothetical protein